MMTERNKRPCPNSRYETEKFEPIPLDLVIEILTRLPAKSLARFRCVSKLWDSTLHIPNFTESFFTISSSRPKLLLACQKDSETFFFSSSPKPPLAINYHMSFPINFPFGTCRPVRGLVCGLTQRTLKGGRRVTVPWICNPSTGQYLPLPRVKTRRKRVITYLGYDPIEKQIKVLCMTNSCVRPNSLSEEHQVLTLGTGKKLSWRKINCDIAHEPGVYVRGVQDGVCINGVCYYLAMVRGGGDLFPHIVPGIVCFDFRSEKFSCIKKAQGMMLFKYCRGDLEPALVNHKGKLATLQPNSLNNWMYNDGIQLWVLEDAKKHEWSNYIYVWPPTRKNIFQGTRLCFVGTTNIGEIVLSPHCISDPFYLVYYNPERKSFRKVDIKGMEAFKSCKSHIFLDHVENVEPMTSVNLRS